MKISDGTFSLCDINGKFPSFQFDLKQNSIILTSCQLTDGLYKLKHNMVYISLQTNAMFNYDFWIRNHRYCVIGRLSLQHWPKGSISWTHNS